MIQDQAVHGATAEYRGSIFSSEQCELPAEPDELKDGGQKSMYKHVTQDKAPNQL